MKKVISFSIYGNSRKYLVGLLKNIELAKNIYTDWLVYIYYNQTVPDEFVKLYSTYNNVVLFDMTESSIPGMFWRFLPNDVDLFIARDADSRLNFREKFAVDDWLLSKKVLHIMRDHPHHNFCILGGMWGFRLDKVIETDSSFNMENDVNEYLMNKGLSFGLFDRMVDMDFLRDVIYLKYKLDSYVNDSIFNIDEGVRFPTPMDNFEFVGEIFEEDDRRNYQFNEWKGRKERGW
jgi:hypothetical protein